jgi:hypothetical protein
MVLYAYSGVDIWTTMLWEGGIYSTNDLWKVGVSLLESGYRSDMVSRAPRLNLGMND